jgi:hypothetical protein
MGLNPFDSGNDEEVDDEVYIGDSEEVVKENEGSRSQNDRAPSDGDTLETELEEKLVGSDEGHKSQDTGESSAEVSLEDVHRQNEEIIDLLEKINNKI